MKQTAEEILREDAGQRRMRLQYDHNIAPELQRLSPPSDAIIGVLIHKVISYQDFANQMGLHEELCADLLTGGIRISPMLAEKLQQVLGPDKQFWLNRQELYDKKKREIFFGR